MDYYEVLNRRRMHRAFSTQSIEESILNRILMSSTKGPSAGYSQGFDFLIIKDQSARDDFWSLATTTEWRAKSQRHQNLWDAPIIILPLAIPSKYAERYSEPDKNYSNLDQIDNWPVPYWYIDTAFATMLLLGAIVNENLGALFFGLFRNIEELKDRFSIPDNYIPIGAIALGHHIPNDPSKSTSRGKRQMQRQFHLDHFGNEYHSTTT